MSKENNESAHGPFGKKELNVYPALQGQVERLKPKPDLFGPETKKYEKEKRIMLMEKEHELASLSGKLPEWISPEGQYLAQTVWLAVTEKATLPRSERDMEIQHACGPIGVLASAVAKSEKYQEPKLEVHLTACPSYLDDEDWRKEQNNQNPIFVYKDVNWKLIEHLKQWVDSIKAVDASGSLVSKIYLHTPGPVDLVYVNRFPGLFGILGNLKGQKSAEVHWGQMEAIAKYCGLSLVSDVGYIIAEAFRMRIDMGKMAQRIEEVDVIKFVQSRYVNDAYIRWGAQAISVLEVFYLGSVVGYGNLSGSFSLDNSDSLKLYINCEEGWSPETFAGAKTGVDFRHILRDFGFHLPLLIGAIRTPWAGREKYDQK